MAEQYLEILSRKPGASLDGGRPNPVTWTYDTYLILAVVMVILHKDCRDIKWGQTLGEGGIKRVVIMSGL